MTQGVTPTPPSPIKGEGFTFSPYAKLFTRHYTRRRRYLATAQSGTARGLSLTVPYCCRRLVALVLHAPFLTAPLQSNSHAGEWHPVHGIPHRLPAPVCRISGIAIPAPGPTIKTAEGSRVTSALIGCGKKTLERCHSGARALPASPESKNTDPKNQWLGLCSWVPGLPPDLSPGTSRNDSGVLPHPAKSPPRA